MAADHMPSLKIIKKTTILNPDHLALQPLWLRQVVSGDKLYGNLE